MKVVKVLLTDRSNDIEVSIETTTEVMEAFINLNNKQAFALENDNVYFPLEQSYTMITAMYNSFIPGDLILLVEEATVKSAMSTEHVGYRASLVRINKETAASLMFTVISSMGPVKLFKDEEYTIRKIKRTFQSFYRIS